MNKNLIIYQFSNKIINSLYNVYIKERVWLEMNLSFKHRPLQFDLMKYRIVLIKIKFLKSMDIFYCIDYNGVRNNFIF